jgi:ATP-dependent RNA helicase SrmB
LSSFDTLELDDELLSAVRDMGYTQATSIQQLVIPEAMEGRDILACAPTGTGKTAAFILPICQFLLDYPNSRKTSARALVLVPTRELAYQVAEQAKLMCKHTDLTCGVITGGINYGTDTETLSQRVDILVATPGRLLEHIQNEKFDLRDIESLVLDEADRMLDMGFATVVNQIANEAKWRKQTMLFSATLEGKGVKHFAKEILEEPVELSASPSRKEKAKTLQWYHLCDDRAHKDQLLDYLLKNDVESCIVFVKTRERLHDLKDRLFSEGFKIAYLQGEMPQDKRMAALKSFKDGEVNILIATDVAARGIDVAEVSHVINYDMPRSADVYVHRIGRTGRAGAKGIAISLIEAHDFRWVDKIARYTQDAFKPRVIESLKPKHKPPVVTKKKKAKVKKGAKSKAKPKRKSDKKSKGARPSSPKE